MEDGLYSLMLQTGKIRFARQVLILILPGRQDPVAAELLVFLN